MRNHFRRHRRLLRSHTHQLYLHSTTTRQRHNHHQQLHTQLIPLERTILPRPFTRLNSNTQRRLRISKLGSHRQYNLKQHQHNNNPRSTKQRNHNRTLRHTTTHLPNHHQHNTHRRRNNHPKRNNHYHPLYRTNRTKHKHRTNSHTRRRLPIRLLDNRTPYPHTKQ